MEKYNETCVVGAQKGRSFGSRDAHEGNGVKRKYQRDDEGFSEMQPTYYITLAKESPRESIFESDDATYDSFHGRETGNKLCAWCLANEIALAIHSPPSAIFIWTHTCALYPSGRVAAVKEKKYALCTIIPLFGRPIS